MSAGFLRNGAGDLFHVPMGYMVCEKSMVDTNLVIRQDDQNHLASLLLIHLDYSLSLGNLTGPSWDSDSGL